MKNYSLKKSLSIFFYACNTFKKRKHTLSSEISSQIEFRLAKLQEFISSKDKISATAEAKVIEKLLKTHFPLSNVTKFVQSASMLLVALFFAIIIRQTCFEPMEIPTGSMRPTFREGDRLIVSYSQFGINVPLMPKHFTFSPDEVKRMGTIVFTSEGMDIPGSKINYFYVFPGYKRMVKRTIGLPEDTLYFYGGKVYGIDKEGNDISNDLQKGILSHIEHIPFISLTGRPDINEDMVGMSVQKEVIVKQNHLPIVKLTAKGKTEVTSKLLQDNASDVHELWGMGNYGMARIVPSESLYFSDSTISLLLKNPEAKYFLEISHHASVSKASNTFDYRGVKRPSLQSSVSYIPLSTKSLERIWDNLYTSRFTSNKGYLQQFGKSYTSSMQLKDRPKIKGHLEDGTYEFIDGIAYKVNWQNDPFSMVPSLSIPKQVSKDHPFGSFSEANCVALYNMGIEQSRFISGGRHPEIAPSRYAYFRDGDLYLMGKMIFKSDSEVLKTFVLTEREKSITIKDYVSFVDEGAPILTDGTIDKEKIQTYGLHVPKKSYYCLGDNHAQSGDSREFGFVPEDNIKGVASTLLWAPGGRAGAPLQEPYPLFNIHKIFVWSVLFIGIALYYVRASRKYRLVKNSPLERFTNGKESFINMILVR